MKHSTWADNSEEVFRRLSSTVLERVVSEGRDELTPEEAREYVADQTRLHFGLSIEDFVRKAEDGSLPEDDPVVVHLALLTGARLHYRESTR